MGCSGPIGDKEKRGDKGVRGGMGERRDLMRRCGAETRVDKSPACPHRHLSCDADEWLRTHTHTHTHT